MSKLLLCLAVGAALTATAEAQSLPKPFFRTPTEDIETPAEAFADLKVMRRLAQQNGVRVDRDGREVCDHLDWQRARESLGRKMLNLATFFGQILGRSKHPDDRALSAYGTFYLDDPQHVCQLITFFAEEPERSIREPAFRRSIDFLRVYLPRNAEAEDTGDEPTAPTALYRLEIGPFLGLLSVPDPRDQAQGLWFLAQVMDIRQDSARTILSHSQAHLRHLLVSEVPDVRKQARAFLISADLKRREPPAEDAGDEELLTWLRAVLYDVFPPIDRVSAGLIQLRVSDELERVAEVGRPALTTKAIGETDSGKLASGLHYRGFRIQRLPEPLNKLGIPVGSVITTINAQQVKTGREILDALEELLPAQRRLLVEFVYRGQSMAMEYRLVD